MRPILGDPCLAQHTEWGIPHLTSSKANDWCMCTLLSTAEKLLQANSDLKTMVESLGTRKRSQYKQYNRGTKNLILLKVCQVIQMKLPGKQKWSLGRCTHLLGWCSYEVQVDRWCFCRNHCQLRSTLESSPVPSSHNEEPHQTENKSRSPLKTENESRSPELVPDQWQLNPIYPCDSKECHIVPSTLSQTVQNQSRLNQMYPYLAWGLWPMFNISSFTWTRPWYYSIFVSVVRERDVVWHVWL